MTFSLYKIEIKKCWIMKKLYALKQVTRNKKKKKKKKERKTLKLLS